MKNNDYTSKDLRMSSEIGLRNPTEVLSTNYILKTEQNQSLIKISRLYFSTQALIFNFFMLGLSSFLLFWWCVYYPSPNKSLWYNILVGFVYIVLFLDLAFRIYIWKINVKAIASGVFVLIGPVLLGVSYRFPKMTNFILGTIGISISFVSLLFNIARIYQFKNIKKLEENDAQKMMEFYGIVEDKDNAKKPQNENESNKLVNGIDQDS
ncbi:hypothetical protein SteCoe_11788 [Stentor coeruleus]|uniref:Uncharacterized protein n=1 Tax=Stentor coeruleus TaxID=5963 RepID=A0A1R2CCA7_9CILI|nr:hypothetical protein SteCoe_11788 [Stentor coeruleus]